MIWKNYDDTVLETDTDVPEGSMPEYNGNEPVKPATPQYTYAFTGWTPTVSEVTGDATYTAVFSETLNTYTVTWLNYDGTVLKTDENVPYGTVPKYEGETPVKAATAEYTYTFSGWSQTLSEVTGDVSYKAVFSETPVEIPDEPEEPADEPEEPEAIDEPLSPKTGDIRTAALWNLFIGVSAVSLGCIIFTVTVRKRRCAAKS